MITAGRLRGIRAAMLVAAIAAASAAFGLHPEPALDGAVADSLGLRHGVVSVEASGAHDCLACRAHRPLVSAPAPSAIATPQRLVLRRVRTRPIAVRSGSPSRCDGRAPPALA